MLMLGESVLSLLIVDVAESSAYYKTFFCGILSITLLDYLHFRSQPHHADDHALRRSKEAAINFTLLIQIYSAALVVLGTSYKMLLFEYAYLSQENGSYRKLWSNPLARLLAGADEPMFATDERQQRVSHFFCISMAVVWLCSDLMIINHRGLQDNLGKCRFSHSGFLRFVAISLAFLRLALIVFMATLSQWVVEPSVLALVGLIGIICQVLLRVVGSSYFGPEYESHLIEDELWPNATKPQVEGDPSD
jgi:small-conductance mechanosensitive channel